MDIQNYLNRKGYVVVPNSPITENNPKVYELEDGKILKVTKDYYEIKAAMSLSGKLSDNIADIYEVEKYNEYHMILIQKLEPLTKEDQKSHRKFERAFRRFFIHHHAIKWFTFGLINPKFGRFKRLLTKNTKRWYQLAKEMKKDAHRMGIEYPSDFLSVSNIGYKPDGKIACYDVRDVKDDIFYEKI